MKYKIDCNNYDTLLQPTDWRYSAAVVGLVKYLEFHKREYTLLFDSDVKPDNYIQGFDGVMYNQNDVTEERYLEFAENYFEPDMTHIDILRILENTTFSDEQIKYVNELSKRKTILKNVFGKEKFNGDNKVYFVDSIKQNRMKIIKEIFRNGKNLYSNFCNSNLMLTDENPHCRLVGYNVDEGRKTKNLGFCFSKESFVGNDIIEFDFIPFAFSNSDRFETFFVNDNYSVKSLITTNTTLSNQLRKSEDRDSRNCLYNMLRNANRYIDYDVEIITKSREEEFYKTFYARSERLKALRMLGEKELQFKYKFSDDRWLNLEKEVSENCLNGVCLDELILVMLKISFDSNYNSITVKKRIQTLIDIDQLWKGNDIMSKIDDAKQMGSDVSKKLSGKSNKINSYKQKLIGALTAHDYDRVNEILLNLSAYVGMEFSFFYTLLENPEENKNIAFAFASALTDKNTDKKGE